MTGAKAKPLRRYFFDTEFMECGNPGFDDATKLISIGIVNAQGHRYYAVVDTVDKEAYAKEVPWLKKNVLDKLPPKSEWKP